MAEALSIPDVEDQQAFNAQRWEELRADPFVAGIEGRIETDRFGHILMTPPPGFSHSTYQGKIAYHLQVLKSEGTTATECPISTSEGVKAADVAWISNGRLDRALENNLLIVAPEICVEVLSPSNSASEIAEKKHLYFQAGADEVWICDLNGRMFFFSEKDGEASQNSGLSPEFPPSLD